MPTYDYKCEQCGDCFEHFQSMSSEPLKVCQKCGGKLHRLFGSGAGVIFKGNGFYCTDYHSATKGTTLGNATEKAPAKPATPPAPAATKTAK